MKELLYAMLNPLTEMARLELLFNKNPHFSSIRMSAQVEMDDHDLSVTDLTLWVNGESVYDLDEDELYSVLGEDDVSLFYDLAHCLTDGEDVVDVTFTAADLRFYKSSIKKLRKIANELFPHNF